MTFGERIYKLRTDKGMTQDELAISVGYKSRSTIAKIESGEREPHQSMIVALAKALNVSPAFLMGWEENNAPAPSSRDDVINKINALPEDKIDKLLGYLDGLSEK